VVNELKDKAPALMAMGSPTPAAQPALADDDVVIEPSVRISATPAGSSAQSEALSALQNLGYAAGDAAGAVAEAGGAEPSADTPELIRAALKLLAPKG
jgi:Holliday junction DNA helicase RuvA